MNRRELLLALMAGGVITAEGLWLPGTKLISIPDYRARLHRWDMSFIGDAAIKGNEFMYKSTRIDQQIVHFANAWGRIIDFTIEPSIRQDIWLRRNDTLTVILE